MRNTTAILLVLTIAALALARLHRSKPSPFRHLQGRHKWVGFIAAIIAIVIMLNPDFLALGLLGDTAFFDVLVLALSVQMLVTFQYAWHHCRAGFLKSLRWLGIPSPGFRYLMCASFLVVASAMAMIEKLAHRISS